MALPSVPPQFQFVRRSRLRRRLRIAATLFLWCVIIALASRLAGQSAAVFTLSPSPSALSSALTLATATPAPALTLEPAANSPGAPEPTAASPSLPLAPTLPHSDTSSSPPLLSSPAPELPRSAPAVLTLPPSAAAARASAPAPAPDAPVTVATSTDNYPYSFLDDAGRPAGFAVEVFDAAARRMGLRFTRVTGPATAVGARFFAGELAAHPFFSAPRQDHAVVDCSVPYVTLQLALFVRTGDHRIAGLDDLRRGTFRLATGGAGGDYARWQQIPESCLVLTSPAAALEAVAAGRADAALFTRVAALAALERHGITGVETSPVALPDAMRPYGFAVRHGDTELLARLNEGLALLQRSGEFDEIYQKWFGRFEPRRFSRVELIGYVALALGLALVLAVWALVRQHQLRARLARQAEELAESRAILAEAQQFASVGHWRYDPVTHRLDCSEETLRIYERAPAMLADLIGGGTIAEREALEAATRRARDQGKSYELDAAIEPRPGLRKTLHLRGRPVRDALGQVTAIFGIVQDVSSAREAERALLQSERLLRALYENLPYAVGVAEKRSGIWRSVSLNPSAVRLLGFKSPPPIGLTLADLGLPPARQKFWTDFFDRCTAAGHPIATESHNAERHRFYSATVVPLGRSGEHDRCCFFIEDITARKQTDAEIAQGRRLRAIGELVGGIAHEFNNLLTPVLLKADMLQAEWQHEPALADELGLIAETTRRSAELTRRLLAFGRRAEPRPAQFPFAALVENNVNLLRHTIDRRIAIDTDLAADLPALFLNQGEVQQILINLLLNARDTLDEKLAERPEAAWSPRIVLGAVALPAAAATPLDPAKPIPDSWIRFTCTDNGMGMRREVLERVFEPFYTTKEVGRGTGLGLATVWHLVSDMGGRIKVESRPLRGSTFEVLLPVFPAPAALPPAAAPHPIDLAPLATSVRRHYLLAEDEPMIAEIVGELVARAGGHVTHCADGRTAWERLSGAPEKYHAVIVDLNMPGLTGLEILRRARRLPYDRPVIVISGRISPEEQRELLALRARAIIQKPFSIDTLMATLTAAGIEGVATPSPDLPTPVLPAR